MRALVVTIAASGAMALAAPPVSAEIVFLEGGQVASGDALYAYQHPSLRSVVFVTEESRQMAILPPPVVFVPPAPLIYRVPTVMPGYVPPMVSSFNTPARPSNQDMNNYNLQRAHGFSQELYYKDRGVVLTMGSAASPYYYGYGYGSLGVPYPPPSQPGFNQPARPSNQSMNIYNLERAHRFSMDLYKK